MSPYRLPEERPAEPAIEHREGWLLHPFVPLDEFPPCRRCGARSGGEARLCSGEWGFLRIVNLCPFEPHFHLRCVRSPRASHPCGHAWLMATHDRPEVRFVEYRFLFERLFGRSRGLFRLLNIGR